MYVPSEKEREQSERTEVGILRLPHNLQGLSFLKGE